MEFEHNSGLNCDDGNPGDSLDALLDVLRSSTLDLPNELAFNVIYQFTVEGLTDPGEEVHVLTDVCEPSGRYHYGLLINSGRRITSFLLAGSDGTIGHGRILSEGGDACDVGPRPGWSTCDEWVQVAIETAIRTLMRRNEGRSPDFANDRVRAGDHLPLLEYKARTGCGIRLRSWRLADTAVVPEVEGARVELWTGVLADGVITYSAIAAGYRADGTIAALVCIEGMPSAHNLAFLGLFAPDGAHQNLGTTTPDVDLYQLAMPLLVPHLAEPLQ